MSLSRRARRPFVKQHGSRRQGSGVLGREPRLGLTARVWVLSPWLEHVTWEGGLTCCGWEVLLGLGSQGCCKEDVLCW